LADSLDACASPRQVEPAARRLRARPLQLKVRLDLSDSATSKALADLARSLPAAINDNQTTAAIEIA
jgi:hypothetical protein